MTATPQPWTIVSSERLIDDRWIHLRADTCLDGAGRTIAPYYIHESADWISVFAIDEDGSAVVLDEYRPGARIVAPGIVGGGVEPGEDPGVCAARELREETGREAGRFVELGWTWANWGGYENRVHYFLALDCRVVAEQQLDSGELITVRTVPLAETDGMFQQVYHQLNQLKAKEWLAAHGR
ncbi:NUDIX hydrolase [Microbacterium nymphoidis]|uniref:NUDIX hydrolase n=1 Tax=Microbacterium nymphoidis TaxID=2898586 RepID=UPI001E497952|nr:NUDIX hydrolase [Microbacterium nymphoidis]MCD2499628.1 NUDIX hydrolase [Microbacterium nymphoidis]